MTNNFQRILEKQTIEASAPCRIDMGGTLDIRTFYYQLRHLSPCTFNIAVDLRTRVRLLPYCDGRIRISSKGTVDELKFSSINISSLGTDVDHFVMVISERPAEKITCTIKKIIELGGDGILLKGDISKFKDVEKIINLILENKNQIDILVNNAGIYYRNSFENISNEIWEKVISTNLTGSFYLCRKVIPFMKPFSRIMFISSQAILTKTGDNLQVNNESNNSHY